MKRIVVVLLVVIASGVGYLAYEHYAEKVAREKAIQESNERTEKSLQRQIDQMNRY